MASGARLPAVLSTTLDGKVAGITIPETSTTSDMRGRQNINGPYPAISGPKSTWELKFRTYHQSNSERSQIKTKSQIQLQFEHKLQPNSNTIQIQSQIQCQIQIKIQTQI